MLTAKLVVLAAALSAVALAAPRSFDEYNAVVAEDTMMVQSSAETSSAVETLQKQFNALQVQLKDGAEVTPGIVKVIGQMKDMIKQEVEPAITTAHASDQSELNTLHRAITDYNGVQKGTRSLLYSNGNNIEKLSGEHNKIAATWSAAASAYTAAISHYEKTTKSKTNTCCDKQQAAVPATQYTPAYHKCDYTDKDAAGCTDRAEAAVKKAVEDAFAAGLARYKGLVTGCASLTKDQIAAGVDLAKKDRHCDDSEASGRAYKKQIQKLTKQFNSDWSTATTTYASGISKREGAFSRSLARVKKDEKDRVSEWRSTQEIYCLLDNYQKGGHFDDASLNKCKATVTTDHLVIHYPTVPHRLVWTKPTFTALTDWRKYATTCHLEEKADETLDTKCALVSTPAIPKCTPSTPAPGKQGGGGPYWTLSTAGAKYAK